MADIPTLLVIYPTGVAPFSARGITQAREPIAQAADLRRTVNGELVNFAAAQFRKYKCRFSCTDINSPAFDNLWPGDTVLISCIDESGYFTGADGSPSRAIVFESFRAQGEVSYYRQHLNMMVTAGPMVSTDEWGAQVSWSIELEEV